MEKRYEVIKFPNGQYGLKDHKCGHDLVIEAQLTMSEAEEFCRKLNRLESYRNTGIVELFKER